MIVDRELDVAAPRDVQVHRRKILSLRKVLLSASIIAAFFAITLALQVASGAYHAEFDGYPDEPAHYVTSLMVREFLISGPLVAPLDFAKDYYNHYPKVAFGHWPPLFYLIQALWTLLFSVSRASVLSELALTTALLGFSLYREALKWFSQWLAVLAGITILCLPLVQLYTAEEMSETLLTLVCFWAAVLFSRYMHSHSCRDSAWFGVWFSLAVMTKGSGWLLVIVPAVALALTRKFALVKRRSFWLAPAIILGICVPWQVMTMHLAQQGWVGAPGPSISYSLTALEAFLAMMIPILGPVFAALTIVGVAVRAVPISRSRVTDRAAVMLGLAVAVWIFHAIVPAGIEDRKMIIAAPALLLFAFAGIAYVGSILPRVLGSLRLRQSLACAASLTVFALTTFSVPRQTGYGFRDAANYLTHLPDWRNSTVLVSSASIGEGALISEIAMRQPRPETTLIRATKAMANVDWSGKRYQSTINGAADVIAFCRAKNVKFLVIDTYPPQTVFAHNEMVGEAARDGEHFKPIAAFTGYSGAAGWSDPVLARGRVQVFRFEP